MKKNTAFFGKWTRIVEASETDKLKVKLGKDQKIILTPKDQRTLKIKLIEGADILTPDEKLTPSGFRSLLEFIKNQPSIIAYYPALNDLTANIVVYTVSRDTDRAQVIDFNIGSKAELGAINPQVRYVRQDELDLARSGTILNTDEIKTIQKPTAPFRVPMESAKIKDSTDSGLIEWMRETYKKIMKEPVAAQNKIMEKVKRELGAKKLGNDSQIFIMGLNAGYGVYDWSGQDIETDITQKLIDKVALTPAVVESQFYLHPTSFRLVEAASTIVTGFDPDAFNAEIIRAQAGAAISTGDVKVPADGFKFGLRKDPEFKKLQDIMVKNLPIVQGGALAGVPQVRNFVKAVPMVGDYGPRTKALVLFLKAALTDPKYPDNDSNTMKPDFVNRLLKEFGQIKESFSYISLDGSSLIVEGFDVAAGSAMAGGGGGGGGGGRARSGGGGGGGSSRSGGGTGGSSKNIRLLEGKPYEYAVKDGIWNFRAKGTSQAWKVLPNPASIKRLQKTYPRDGGSYLIPGISNRYRYANGNWQVLLGSTWTEARQSSKEELTKLYGSKPLSASSEYDKPSIGLDTPAIDKELVDISIAIKGIFTSGIFKRFKSGWGDDEALAWSQGFVPYWNDYIQPRINKLKKPIELITNASLKSKYKRTLDVYHSILYDDKDDSMKDTFQGGNDTDIFTWTIYLSNKTRTFEVDTDI